MTHRKLLSFLLCAALICTLAGFAFVEGHEHDHGGEILDAVLASPIATVTLGDEQVPLSDGAGIGGYPNQPDDGHAHNWVTKSEEVGNDCYYGKTWRAYNECTLCGTQVTTAIRPEGAYPKGQHKIERTVLDSTCPENLGYKEVCSVCGYSTYSVGGHKWGEWSVSTTEGECGGKTYIRSCSACHTTETKTDSRATHTWVTETVQEATCTREGQSRQVCAVCGAEGSVTTIPKKAHSWNEDDGDCTTPVTCTVCGAVSGVSKSAHKLVWESDGTSHWSRCTNSGCTYTTEKENHQGAASERDCTVMAQCTVCGRKNCATGKEHNFDGSGGYIISSTKGHQIRCANPGCQQVSSVIPHDQPDPKAHSCTEGQDCVCGYPIVSAKNNHSFGGWTVTSSGHSRTCADCGYTESGDHSGKTTGKCTDTVKCSVCGYLLAGGYSGHEFGVWTYTNDSTHSRKCVHAGCTVSNSSAHRGGQATCSSQAVCQDCGSAYGEKNPSRHAGGTEIRGYKAASEGVAGYTGDTYCLGCGAMISKGSEIPALPVSHTHSYGGGWKSDGLQHWKECACGEHSSVSAHSFKDGKCTVCGAEDPNFCSGSRHVGGTEIKNAKAAEAGKKGYTGDVTCSTCGKVITKGSEIPALAESHTHNYGNSWKSDGANHWKECSCGEHSAQAAHSFKDGKCTVCGAADPNYKVCSGSRHVGPTELKGSKPAEVGAAGYTGDVTCTVCGKVVSKGQEIPALTPSHSHEFAGGWQGDSLNHWKLCACGEHGEEAAHTFANGKCTVCGAADPNAKAEEAHTHSFGQLHSNGQYHWRECTVCGFQAEKAAHVMVNGSCMECGYTPVAVSAVKDVTEKSWYYEPVKQALEAGILSGGKTGTEAKDFRPEEEVALSDVVDALYRLAGSPMAASETKFTDVKADDYYASAASWVTENNIVKVEGDVFDGTKSTTLQEMVTFLWRFAQTAGWDITSDETDEADAAMRWATDTGLTAGLSGKASDGTITRAEAAAILVNFMSMIEANGLPGIETGVDPAA